MPDNDDFDLEDDDPQDSSVIRKLRKELRDAKRDAAEVPELRQRLVVLEAGLDLTPKQVKALLASHEGDLEPEALKATAVELGMMAAPEAPKDEPQVPEDEQAAHQRVSDATEAAEAVDGKTESLEDKMRKAMEEGGERGLDQFLASIGASVNAQD